ncbi:MAG: DinB family protein [bacterium]
MTGYGATELANAFRGVRKNTLQIAEDIPEDKYDFVAAPGVQTVSEVLRHVAFGPMLYVEMHAEKRVTTLKGYDFGAAIGRSAAEEKKPRNKAEIIALLEAEGERYAKWVESLSPEFLAETFTDPTGQNPRTRFESLLSPKEHEMHHRGQLMLVERMLGIVPHLTRQRQARAQQHQASAAPATAGAH